MEYMGNQTYWDEKFESRGNHPLDPEETLVEHVSLLKKGTVLDIACGDGRNSLFLSSQGFRVFGIDFSESALIRLENFAKERNYEIETKQMDLTKENAFQELGEFDNIVVNHYRLDKKQWEAMIKHLAPGGMIFVCGFGENHTCDAKIKEKDLIKEDDFFPLKDKFNKVKSIETKDERGCFVTYLFRKCYDKTCKQPNYEGRQFIPKLNSANGEVDETTIFTYHQNDTYFWAEYEGGEIIKGHMIGSVTSKGELDFCYQHMNRENEIRVGKCHSVPHILENGKIELFEEWQWLNGDLSKGNSVLVEKN